MNPKENYKKTLLKRFLKELKKQLQKEHIIYLKIKYIQDVYMFNNIIMINRSFINLEKEHTKTKNIIYSLINTIKELNNNTYWALTKY